MPNATDGKPFACFECYRTFTRPPVSDLIEPRVCPNCGGNAVMMSHRFRPPKKTDSAQWKKIRFLVDNGFRFQKIFKYVEKAGYRVAYPETLQEAKEFVETYKDQAYLFDG